MHRERVRDVKPQVDTSMPRVVHLNHVHHNLKKEQMLEDRYSEIDRENRILLKKMSEIMSVGSQATTPRPRADEGRKHGGALSLNRDARKKELLRITKENQSILRRIQQAQPVYNHVEMEGGHRKNTSYLKNCVEYPLVLRTPRSARGPGQSCASSQLVRLGEDPEDSRPQSARSLQRGGGPSAQGQAQPLASREFLPGPQEAPQGPPSAGGPAGGGGPRASAGSGSDQAGLSSAPQSATGGRPATGVVEVDSLDADAMVRQGRVLTAGSVHAQIDLGSSMGEAQVRLRGLTPQSEARAAWST